MNIEGGEAGARATPASTAATNPNDNSGTLRYVRVEFAGIEFSPDNELNGIAFQGSAAAGTYDFIQVHMNRDDGLEWFGGTADIKYAVASNAADDSFDWTFGWTGRAQFIAVHQRGDDADNGIEADNNEFNNDLLPRSNPQIYNMTLCGDPDRNEGAESPRARLFRRGTAVTFRNFLITGFKTTGMQIDGADARRRSTMARRRWAPGSSGASRPTLHASVAPYVTSGRSRTFVSASIRACRRSLLQPRGAEFPAGLHRDARGRPVGADSTAERRLLRAVTFIGAVPPAPAEDWTAGWTSYPQR